MKITIHLDVTARDRAVQFAGQLQADLATVYRGAANMGLRNLGSPDAARLQAQRGVGVEPVEIELQPDDERVARALAEASGIPVEMIVGAAVARSLWVLVPGDDVPANAMRLDGPLGGLLVEPPDLGPFEARA